MGLDMHFYAGQYASEHEHFGKKLEGYPEELKGLEEYIRKRNFISAYKEYQVGYFRKFNALHQWIVDKCGHGIDECQQIYISDNQLGELYDTLLQVSHDHSKASELLPSQSGFFFGSTEYDDWYYEDVEEAIKFLELVKPLVDSGEIDLIYQASW